MKREIKIEMDEIIERLSELAERSFEDFKKKMLEKSKEEIFNNNYEIRFYDEMYEFFTGGGSESLGEHTVVVLYSLGRNLLNLLYDDYIGREYSSINSWDDICEWLDQYAENTETEEEK